MQNRYIQQDTWRGVCSKILSCFSGLLKPLLSCIVFASLMIVVQKHWYQSFILHFWQRAYLMMPWWCLFLFGISPSLTEREEYEVAFLCLQENSWYVATVTLFLKPQILSPEGWHNAKTFDWFGPHLFTRPFVLRRVRAVGGFSSDRSRCLQETKVAVSHLWRGRQQNLGGKIRDKKPGRGGSTCPVTDKQLRTMTSFRHRSVAHVEPVLKWEFWTPCSEEFSVTRHDLIQVVCSIKRPDLFRMM